MFEGSRCCNTGVPGCWSRKSLEYRGIGVLEKLPLSTHYSTTPSIQYIPHYTITPCSFPHHSNTPLLHHSMPLSPSLHHFLSFRRPQNDRFIHTAQMQIPLGKGNLDFRFPETPVNLLVKLTFYLQPVISIHYPDAKLEVE